MNQEVWQTNTHTHTNTKGLGQAGFLGNGVPSGSAQGCFSCLGTEAEGGREWGREEMEGSDVSDIPGGDS